MNVSSVRGRFSWPGYSAYQISKYGVETMSDSLRPEMVKFGVKVSLIEPGRYGGATSAASPEMVDIFTVYYRIWRSRRGRDRMVVGFTTTYAISVYLHINVVSSNPAHGEMYNIM